MGDDIKELEDKATYLTMATIMAVAMIVGAVARDTRIMLIGAVAVGVPVTFALALLRHAWNERSDRRRRRALQSEGTAKTAYDSPSTRRT